jgi:chromosome partitioning protein
MKSLVLANQKGGVGKTAIACQFAYYLADVLGLRVLVLDVDHQANTTKAMKASGLFFASTTTAGRVLSEKTDRIEAGKNVLVPSDELLIKMEKQADRHNRFATNLQIFLKTVDNQFDACIIDTNPNPDIRVTAALVVADYVLSPVQLNQEALDGIGALAGDVKKIKAALNPKLHFIGILPNLVEATPFQKANFTQLAEQFAKLLIPLANGHAFIKTRTAIAEAQAAGQPIWRLGKTSAADCWRELRPVFAKITDVMELKNGA